MRPRRHLVFAAVLIVQLGLASFARAAETLPAQLTDEELSKSGRVYMGVGPEQNFTYIAALKPKMVFIVDIRRGNLDLQLMYKAIFEMSKDRAEFVSRLFAKKQPSGIGPNSTVEEIFNAVVN